MPEKFPMDEIYPAPPRSGWNWGGCLVLVVILAVLVGLLLPVMNGFQKGLPPQSMCGKNQSQILGAMVAYAASEETAWPDPRGTMAAWKLPAGPIMTALDAAKYTAGALELLAVSQSIPNGLFKCPSTSWGGPSKKVKASLSETTVQWGWDPTASVAVSYGFDWASPADPSSQRVILADRDPKNHNLAVMAVYGDAHVKKLKLVEVERGTGVLVTESGLTSSRKTGTGVQPDDDIFSNEGDAGDSLTPGKGDPLRAWVK
jgi:hypothetical protein